MPAPVSAPLYVESVYSQYVQNGSGAKLFLWPPGKSQQRAAFPMFVTQITYSGISTPSLDTTHLATQAPNASNEFGGRTKIPALLSDPGQLTLECLHNASVVLPKGAHVFQLQFPLPRGHVRAARWMGLGFISNRGNISIMTDTIMTQQVVIDLTGNIAVTAAKRVKG